MFNYNSPAINNMQMGGMNRMGSFPSNPIGNVNGMVNVGMSGYNGGYYNGNYNGYVNPFYLRQQQEMQLLQQREIERQQSDMLKSISRKVNNALGIEQNEEHYNQYNPVYETQQQMSQEEQTYYRLMNIERTGFAGNPLLIRYINNNNAYFDSVKQRIPDDISMYDFCEMSSEIGQEIIDEKLRNQQRNLGKLYNSNGYNELIKMHKNTSNFFNTMISNKNQSLAGTLDDMSIGLSSNLQNQISERKSRFMAAVMNP